MGLIKNNNFGLKTLLSFTILCNSIFTFGNVNNQQPFSSNVPSKYENGLIEVLYSINKKCLNNKSIESCAEIMAKELTPDVYEKVLRDGNHVLNNHFSNDNSSEIDLNSKYYDVHASIAVKQDKVAALGVVGVTSFVFALMLVAGAYDNAKNKKINECIERAEYLLFEKAKKLCQDNVEICHTNLDINGMRSINQLKSEVNRLIAEFTNSKAFCKHSEELKINQFFTENDYINELFAKPINLYKNSMNKFNEIVKENSIESEW